MGKGRAPCCDKTKVKRGPWSYDEDLKLISFIQKYGHKNWRSLPNQAGLLRCGMSCRLLRPDVKRGNFSAEEEETIVKLHQSTGSNWSKIASKLPERTDNEIKHVWHTHVKKRLSSNTNLDANDEAATKGSLNRELNQISTGRFIYKLYNSSFVLETQLKDSNHDDKKKHLDSFNREYVFKVTH